MPNKNVPLRTPQDKSLKSYDLKKKTNNGESIFISIQLKNRRLKQNNRSYKRTYRGTSNEAYSSRVKERGGTGAQALPSTPQGLLVCDGKNRAFIYTSESRVTAG